MNLVLLIISDIISCSQHYQCLLSDVTIDNSFLCDDFGDCSNGDDERFCDFRYGDQFRALQFTAKITLHALILPEQIGSCSAFYIIQTSENNVILVMWVLFAVLTCTQSML